MENKINPYEVDSINRLAIVGKSGMGALEYYPENIYEIVANDLKDYINQSYK